MSISTDTEPPCDGWPEPPTGWTWAAYEQAVMAAPELAREEDVLAAMHRDLAATGLIGEQDTAAIVMLAMVSLAFEQRHIVSVAIKGQSSSGKSNAMNRVLEMWTEVRPGSSGGEYIRFGSVSPMALVYDKRKYHHRMLVMEEAIGISRREDPVAHQLRLMLSEGYFEHNVTDGTEGINTAERGTVSIRKEGPAGFLVTTTLLKLEEELETRMVSVFADESEAQTARIIRATAEAVSVRGAKRPRVLGEQWHELTRWLSNGTGANRNVVLDEECTDRVGRFSSGMVRGRRDVGKVAGLIKAHAMVHQLYRARDEQGNVIADIDDYRAVAKLLRPVLDREHQASVPDHVRTVVAAVTKATTVNQYGGTEHPSGRKVAAEAGAAQKSVSRWLLEAQQAGYLVNLSPGRGTPDRWAIDAPLPEEQTTVLPDVPEEPPAPWQPGWRFTITKSRDSEADPASRDSVTQPSSEAELPVTQSRISGDSAPDFSTMGERYWAAVRADRERAA